MIGGEEDTSYSKTQKAKHLSFSCPTGAGCVLLRVGLDITLIDSRRTFFFARRTQGYIPFIPNYRFSSLESVAC